MITCQCSRCILAKTSECPNLDGFWSLYIWYCLALKLLHLLAWRTKKAVHCCLRVCTFRPDLYLHCQYGKWVKKMLIHYWKIFISFFFFFFWFSLYQGWKPQFMFMTVGIFLNVYILSNKLLEDFLAVLLSVWFTVTSCIYHLLEWNFYFWERTWDYSSVE